MAADSVRPLDNFQLIRSSNLDDVRDAIERICSRPALTPAGDAGDFNARINNYQLRRIGLLYATYGTAIEVAFPESLYFVKMLPMRGGGEVISGPMSASLNNSGGAVISTGCPYKAYYNRDYEFLAMRIDPQALSDKLTAMTGATVNAPLRFNLQQNFKHPATLMLRQYIPLLADTLNSATSPFPDWWIAQTEQLLMTLFLCGHRHNYSHLMEQQPRDPAPQQVRRAEEYIEANAQRAITLEELAEVTGVSAFSLFSSFKKSRGYSPMAFAAWQRAKRDGFQ